LDLKNRIFRLLYLYTLFFDIERDYCRGICCGKVY
jgi:hypothetical protein